MISSRPDASNPFVPNCASAPDEVSLPRKIAAWSIRGAGFLLGAALVSIYLFTAWEAPSDMSHTHFRYLTGPLLLFCGPMLLAGWIAWRIDHRRLTD
jgi:hypothetical protein